MRNNIFVMIKPWGLHHADEIFRTLDETGKRLETIKVDHIPEQAVRLQHVQYKDEPFFQLMIQDLADQQCIIALYKGNQDEFNLQKSYLRERFGGEIIPLPPLKRNALHISASEQEFNRDFNAWRNYLNGN